MKNIFILLIFALIMITGGIKTIITKEINGGKLYLFLGNYSYVYGGIFIIIGILVIYNIIIKIKK